MRVNFGNANPYKRPRNKVELGLRILLVFFWSMFKQYWNNRKEWAFSWIHWSQTWIFFISLCLHLMHIKDLSHVPEKFQCNHYNYSVSALFFFLIAFICEVVDRYRGTMYKKYILTFVIVPHRPITPQLVDSFKVISHVALLLKGSLSLASLFNTSHQCSLDMIYLHGSPAWEHL